MDPLKITLSVLGTLIIPTVAIVAGYLITQRTLRFRRLPRWAHYLIEIIFFSGLSIGVGYYCGYDIVYISSNGIRTLVTFGTTAFAVYISGLLCDFPVAIGTSVVVALFRGLINRHDPISIPIVIAILSAAAISIVLRYVVFRKERIRWYYAAAGTTLVECLNNALIMMMAGAATDAFTVLQYVDLAVILIEFISASIIFIVIDHYHFRFNAHMGRKISNKIQRHIFIGTAISAIVLALGTFAISFTKTRSDIETELDAITLSVQQSAELIPFPKEDAPIELKTLIQAIHNELLDNLAYGQRVESSGFVLVVIRDKEAVRGGDEDKGYPIYEFSVGPAMLPERVGSAYYNDVVCCRKEMTNRSVSCEDAGDGHELKAQIEEGKRQLSINGHKDGTAYLEQFLYKPGKEKPKYFTVRFDNAIASQGVEYLANYSLCNDNHSSKEGNDPEHGILTVISLDEIALNARIISRSLIYTEIVAFITLYFIVYVLIKRVIVKKIDTVNSALNQIIDGDINVTLQIKDTEEFEQLSENINLTVGALKNYGEEINHRIEDDLELAKNIQYSSVPLLFPFDNEYEIYANMFTAKEVGGDFYDYLKLGDDRVMFLIADVSGKGIPASLHMMRAKTLIKSLSHTIEKPEEILRLANNELCYQNKAGLFVTAWLGILNTKTGVLTYANAGHCAPLVRHNQEWSYIKGNKNFVLGGFDGIAYKPNEIKLDPSDMIILYTDGVTEATNKDKELYGEQRLLETVKKSGDTNCELIVDQITAEVNKFQSGVDQFDDVTILAVRYFGGREDKNDTQLNLYSHFGNVSTAVNFIQHRLLPYQLEPKAVNAICLASNELLDNIVSHAYPNNKDGVFTVKVEVTNADVLVTFTDDGPEFDPAHVKFVKDINGKISNLGIYIAKKNVDEMRYRRINNQNVLTIVKHRKQ
ncbi:MAG: SpoIIE family protein phosphatase [Bacilli bacterium]|nr:SpoIIE family protein phosphatase [Bacilli bacterium]